MWEQLKDSMAVEVVPVGMGGTAALGGSMWSEVAAGGLEACAGGFASCGTLPAAGAGPRVCGKPAAAGKSTWSEDDTTGVALGELPPGCIAGSAPEVLPTVTLSEKSSGWWLREDADIDRLAMPCFLAAERACW